MGRRPVSRKAARWQKLPEAHRGIMDEKLCFCDLETAGLAIDSQIIQIAAIAVDAANLTEFESFEVKLRFDLEVADPTALQINTFEPTVWKRLGVRPLKAADAFARFLRRHATVDMHSQRTGKPYRVAQLVAHNAAFDGPKLQRFYHQHGMFLPGSRRVYCTLQRAYWVFEEDRSLTPPADFKLATLCQYFGVRLPEGQSHNALHDVRATLELYRALREHAAANRLEDAA